RDACFTRDGRGRALVLLEQRFEIALLEPSERLVACLVEVFLRFARGLIRERRLSEGDRAFDGVLQLAHVAWPTPRTQSRERGWRERRLRTRGRGEVLREQRHVIEAIFEWRQLER